MNDSQLVDMELFEQLADRSNVVMPRSNATRANYCPDCPDVPMLLCLSEYRCSQCFRTESADITAADIKGPGNGNSLNRFRGPGEYTKTQKESIMRLLKSNLDSYNGDKFQLDVLEEVATQYNNIQQITEETHDESGNVNGEKKFVRRSNIKNEVLAALIYFECMNRGLVRKKKDIATFMKLPANGFSTGEDILRTLAADGKFYIPVDDEPIEGFANRYLETLGIEGETAERYVKFITEIIAIAEAKMIGVNSLPPSKVAGTIWILVTQLKLKITVDTLESACDQTKKNTFIKFFNAVFGKIDLFKAVFGKYKVPIK